MSKQSNQKYRKEKERTHLKKHGIDLSANSGRKIGDKDDNTHSDGLKPDIEK